MANSTCYVWDAGKNKVVAGDPQAFQPCAGTGICCIPGDTCVGNFMCKHKDPPPDKDHPTYYISSCTDANFTSAACEKYCYKYFRTGVVYNDTTAKWNCCGTTTDGAGGIKTTCSTPRDDGFSLVPPDQLQIRGVVPLPSSTSTPTASRGSGTGSQAAATSSSVSSNSEGMTQNTQVGLGVGLGIGLTLIFALIAFFVIRARRSKARGFKLSEDGKNEFEASEFVTSKQDAPPSYPSLQNDGSGRSWIIDQDGHELGDNTRRHRELSGRERVELP